MATQTTFTYDLEQFLESQDWTLESLEAYSYVSMGPGRRLWEIPMRLVGMSRTQVYIANPILDLHLLVEIDVDQREEHDIDKASFSGYVRCIGEMKKRSREATITRSWPAGLYLKVEGYYRGSRYGYATFSIGGAA